MGFTISKLLAAVMLIGAGLNRGMNGEAVEAWINWLPAAPLLLAGLFVISRTATITPFNLFRSLAIGASGYGAMLLITSGLPVLQAVEGAKIAASVQLAGSVIVALAIYYALVSPSNIRTTLEHIFAIPELLNKIIFTLALLAIYRIGFFIPIPGVDPDAVADLAKTQKTGAFGEALQYYSMFTGGTLSKSTLFGLGIMPYITASIIFMLLSNVVPALEKLQKEGAAGQKKIQEYTRYATVILCLIQGCMYMGYTISQVLPNGSHLVYPEYAQGGMRFLIFIVGVSCLTTGTVFLMWLGEQIAQYGIGNGISLLIMAGIVVRLPQAIGELFQNAQFTFGGGGSVIGIPKMLFLVASFLFVVAGSILITQAQRRIPIQQAKQTRGRKVYGGQRHYMPLRVNHGGVMPIIFASSLMIIPSVVFGLLENTFAGPTFTMIRNSMTPGSFTYTSVFVLMIFFFAYFWTTVNFRPKQMADQLRDMGHFIPGLRPGKRTSDYLETVMGRITYCGAAFLALIAVLPSVIASKLEIPYSISAFLGGTGLLIMVSVALDLVQRIESQLVMRNYGGMLGKNTRIKGSR